MPGPADFHVQRVVARNQWIDSVGHWTLPDIYSCLHVTALRFDVSSISHSSSLGNLCLFCSIPTLASLIQFTHIFFIVLANNSLQCFIFLCYLYLYKRSFQSSRVASGRSKVAQSVVVAIGRRTLWLRAFSLKVPLRLPASDRPKVPKFELQSPTDSLEWPNAARPDWNVQTEPGCAWQVDWLV